LVCNGDKPIELAGVVLDGDEPMERRYLVDAEEAKDGVVIFETK
jgi:hypothetical protein